MLHGARCAAKCKEGIGIQGILFRTHELSSSQVFRTNIFQFGCEMAGAEEAIDQFYNKKKDKKKLNHGSLGTISGSRK